MSDFSRREVCRGLGLMGAAILLGGCEGLPPLAFVPPQKDASSYPPLLTPDQFEALVGTVKDARAKAISDPDATTDFISRFISFSPKILAAKRTGGVVGSVLIDAPFTAIQLAVNLQLARERTEPAVLHNDLGRIAASQYWRVRRRDFITIVPNTVFLFGDEIHKNRYLLQMIFRGNLPSDKIVQTNQDLESLISRKLAFARLLMTGLPYAEGSPRITSLDIWIDDPEKSRVPDGRISVSLLTALLRLEKAVSAVRDITPVDALQRPAGWQEVSEAYRTFAVGQMIETKLEVVNSKPHNAFEETVLTRIRSNYQPYVLEIKKRMDWNDTRAKAYDAQKGGMEDLLTQQIFLDI